MHGNHSQIKIEQVLLTPEMAQQLLEHNTRNRPISDQHVQRIARQIINDKWSFNGDTIKISENGDVLDGQHRLWAVIEAKRPVATIIVRGITREAFSKIDTLCKRRNGSDVIALCGQERYRTHISGALTWLLRYQRKILEAYREPSNCIENSDIEAAFEAHRAGIVYAVERAMRIRRIINPSLMGFVYYVTANQNLDLANEMMAILDNPAAVAQSNPFFLLRGYYLNPTRERREPVVVIALTFKTLLAAHQDKPLRRLGWRAGSEPFPVLKITGRGARPAAPEAPSATGSGALKSTNFAGVPSGRA